MIGVGIILLRRKVWEGYLDILWWGVFREGIYGRMAQIWICHQYPSTVKYQMDIEESPHTHVITFVCRCSMRHQDRVRHHQDLVCHHHYCANWQLVRWCSWGASFDWPMVFPQPTRVQPATKCCFSLSTASGLCIYIGRILLVLAQREACEVAEGKGIAIFFPLMVPDWASYSIAIFWDSRAFKGGWAVAWTEGVTCSWWDNSRYMQLDWESRVNQGLAHVPTPMM